MMAEDQESIDHEPAPTETLPTSQGVPEPAPTEPTHEADAQQFAPDEELPVNGAGAIEQPTGPMQPFEPDHNLEPGGAGTPEGASEPSEEAKSEEDDDDKDKPAVGDKVFFRSPMHAEEECYFPAFVVRNDQKGVVLQVLSDTHIYIAKNVRKHESEFGHYRTDLPEPKEDEPKGDDETPVSGEGHFSE
jgi:hypothetical protein